MSYDLEVRSKPQYGSGVPLEQVAAHLINLPGVVRTDPTAFGVDRPSAGVTFSIDIGQQLSEDEESVSEAPDLVNYAVFLVPYPFLDRAGPVALEMAFQLAETLDWIVYDLQADRELFRESLPEALRMQKAFGLRAQEVFERAVAADLSFGHLLGEEMWNHMLLSAAACFVLAAIGTAWFLLALDQPRATFDRYMPWGVSIGGVALMWVKGAVQATVRYRRLRRQRAGPTHSGRMGAA